MTAFEALAPARGCPEPGKPGTTRSTAAHAGESFELAVRSDDHAAAAIAGWLQSFTWQLRDPPRALDLLARSEQDATRAGRPALRRCARGFQLLVHSFGLHDPVTGERMCREVLAEALPDSYDRLVALTSILVPLYLRGD